RAHATSPHRTTGDPVGHLVFLHASAIERFLPPSARPSDHSPDWSGLGKEFPETIRALNPRTAKLPESSPSPPLEERVGERRPYLANSEAGSWKGGSLLARAGGVDGQSLPPRPLLHTRAPLPHPLPARSSRGEGFAA